MRSEMRHRSGKYGLESNLSYADDSSRSKLVAETRQRNNLHGGVWVRIIGIIVWFTIFCILLARVTKKDAVPGIENGGANTVAASDESPNTLAPSFVTIVMPSVVKPEARPLRLSNIAKTWGPSSNAIYVVHSEDEFPEGAQNRVESPAIPSTYPQILLVPEDVTVEKGVQRLEHVIRTVSKEINPEFVFFVNDHTFVLPNNLCKFLRDQDSSKDLYAGHALKGKKETAFNSGAAGYVLSRTTINSLIREWDTQNPQCSADGASKWLQGNPGLLTAKCFIEALHISLPDTRDENQSHRFHAYGIIRTVTGKVDEWYENKHAELDSVLGVDNLSHHKLKKGAACCSPSTISFHYVEAGESVVFWDVLQKSRASPSMMEGELKELMMNTWPRDREGLGGYAHGLPSPHAHTWVDLVAVVKKISKGVGDSMC